MSTEDDELQAQAAIGHEALKFKQSDIGRYLFSIAKQDEEEAKTQLLAINVWSYTSLGELQNAIVSLQATVNRFRTIEQYLFEAIATGEQAQYQLNNTEEE